MFGRTFRNKTALIICAACICLIAAAVVVSVLLPDNAANRGGRTAARLYFTNAAGGFQVEERYLPDEADGRELIEGILTELVAGPKNINLVRTAPRETEYTVDYSPGESAVSIALFTDYESMSARERLILEGSVVWSVTGTGFVDEVLLSINGGEAEALNRSNMNVAPALEVVKTEHTAFTLYFADAGSRYLVPELRHTDVDPNRPLAAYILEQLIEGPARADSVATIPPEVKIKDVTVEGDVCYIDLSQDFLSRHPGGESAERLTVYSIVNSISGKTGIKAFQFLIDSEKAASDRWSVDLSMPVEPDYKYISLQPVEE